MSETNHEPERSVSDSFQTVDQIARYLTLDFGGYFMCRIATDPDPSRRPPNQLRSTRRRAARIEPALAGSVRRLLPAAPGALGARAA